MDSPYSVEITATSMTGTQNAWTNVLDLDEKIFFCHFCSSLGFVYFGIEIQRCAFCSYMEPDLVPTLASRDALERIHGESGNQ
jgi:hypothetical protein